MSSRQYRTINTDRFPDRMEIAFVDDDGRQTLHYERVTWTIDGAEQGLRYGENPDQTAALYRLINGNLTIGELSTIEPGRYLASDVELLQSGKHPGKINITDVDSALNILRHFTKEPTTVIVKHNNPSGVAINDTLSESYRRAYDADPIAAFGGVVVVNRSLDKATATAIAESYCEVVAAPEYEEGAVTILSGRKNLRIMRIGNLARLGEFSTSRFVDFKGLIDGGMVVQWSQVPALPGPHALTAAKTTRKGVEYSIKREPTETERNDMYFGWLLEFGITSNSVIYVKDRATVAIGTGEQDRVGVATIARDKAYRKLEERYARAEHGKPFLELPPEERSPIARKAAAEHGGLIGASMISDAYFPFSDGVEIGLKEGVSAVVQPGGSLRDVEVIESCNSFNATMAFTGQRAFKH